MLYLLGFIHLDFAARADYLLLHGRHVASRPENDYEVQLYWTRNFYAEVYYSPDRNRIEKIIAVTEKLSLDVYLEQINLSGLLTQ